MPKGLFIFILLFLLPNCKKKCNAFEDPSDTIYGIDISHYQDDEKKINWKLLKFNKTPKIDFIYIRSTMGIDGKDISYEKNVSKLNENNFAFGVYHYFRPNESGKDQFDNFKKNTTFFGNLPVAIDVEEKGNMSIKKLKNEIKLFIEQFEKEFDNKLIIYSPQKFFNFYLWNSFKKHDIWIARQHGISEYPQSNLPNIKPYLFGSRCPLLWQFSGTGKIDGIEGNVDINISRKSILDYQY